MTKILVIEDEFDIRDEVMSWLVFEGYEALGAADGKEGLRVIRHEQPDLVLCDISMPEMDGHTVLIEMRSNAALQHIPFIFMTASADRDDVRRGMNLGADDYITKPFSHAEILNAVASRLNKQARITSQVAHLSNAIEQEREQRLLKSRLVGMFSHDFRNPLMSILSSSSILQNYADRLSPERQAKHFGQIDGAVHLLLQMLDEMLMVAEVENGQLEAHPQPTELRKLIEKVITEVEMIDRGQHHIHFGCKLPALVQVDPRFVQHIVTNLISNAVKYAPNGTTVTVHVAADGDDIVLTIEDEGIGIPEADLPHIFEPYFRAENARNCKGNGLGLSLVRELAENCGGSVAAASELGRGSCFTVRLPLVEA